MRAVPRGHGDGGSTRIVETQPQHRGLSDGGPIHGLLHRWPLSLRCAFLRHQAFFLYAGVGASVTVVVGWVASWWKVSQLSPRLRREREQAIAGLVVGWGDIAAATQSTPGQGAGDMTCQAASVELVQRARGVQQAREDVEEETERLLTHGDK
eukprot:COSAG01_NODE_20_length_38868_cov_34.606071_25_plen_153_part_00